MSTILYTSCCLSRSNNQKIVAYKDSVANSASEKGCSIAKAGTPSTETAGERPFPAVTRRSAVASAMSLVSTAFAFSGVGLAAVKQGLLAGRIPGLSEPDEQG